MSGNDRWGRTKGPRLELNSSLQAGRIVAVLIYHPTTTRGPSLTCVVFAGACQSVRAGAHEAIEFVIKGVVVWVS